jgi:predicted transglutaminase-like cysteine proteinase
MRGLRGDILPQRTGAWAALALLSLLSACASAPTQPGVMTLGAQAPAPMGYLEFCARRPEQCGLPQVIDAQGAPIDTEHRAQDLRRRYYWSIALAGATTPPPPAPTPASGGGAPSVRSVDLAMWRAAPATAFDAPAPHLDPAIWRGAEPLLQPALLVTPLPDVAHLELATTNPFATKSAPAPADRADDPFDLRDADADAPKPVQPMVVTPRAMTLLNTVNRRVNDSIRYASASALYGNDDYWTLPLEAGGLRAGDCKDYVLEKRKALVEQGVPAGDMSIAVVMLRTGGAHAVLLLATDHGELVLDSLSSWIMPWNRLDYRWISRQAPGQQLVWVKVEQPGRG